MVACGSSSMLKCLVSGPAEDLTRLLRAFGRENPFVVRPRLPGSLLEGMLQGVVSQDTLVDPEQPNSAPRASKAQV